MYAPQRGLSTPWLNFRRDRRGERRAALAALEDLPEVPVPAVGDDRLGLEALVLAPHDPRALARLERALELRRGELDVAADDGDLLRVRAGLRRRREHTRIRRHQA